MNSENFKKEVYRISYALFMVSEQIKRVSVAKKIAEYAVFLLEDVYNNDLDKALKDNEFLSSLVYFSSDTGLLDYEDREVLIEELISLKEVIEREKKENRGAREFLKKDLSSPLPIFLGKREGEENVFFKEGILDGSELLEKDKVLISSELGNSEIRKDSSEIRNLEKASDGTLKRREDILNRIKQSGICFLKDLSVFFPNCSERTLRYDLEWLSKQKKVEKIGSSGPGTFYRAKIE
ncbi:MAG: hypothetical protein PHZ25_00135 [Candidatus Pacebacteria bacterium]|nr:hypothetical protein [Candidatus Paceibacterota bacterium]